MADMRSQKARICMSASMFRAFGRHEKRSHRRCVWTMLICVTKPDVGSGFGMKAMDYPDTFSWAYAAWVLGRAVA